MNKQFIYYYDKIGKHDITRFYQMFPLWAVILCSAEVNSEHRA